MTRIFDRRRFVGLSLALAPWAALPALAARASLAPSATANLVFAILAPAYGLSERHRALMPAFLARLATPGLHTQSPQCVAAWLAAPERHRSELEVYLVEEFVVASNYFAVAGGYASDYSILSIAPGAHPEGAGRLYQALAS